MRKKQTWTLERYLISGEKGYRQDPANTSLTEGTAVRGTFSHFFFDDC